MCVADFYVGLPSSMIMTIKDKNRRILVVDYGKLPCADSTYDDLEVQSFMISEDCVSCTIVVDPV